MLTEEEVLHQQSEDRFRESCDRATREARWAEHDPALAAVLARERAALAREKELTREYRQVLIEQIRIMLRLAQLPAVPIEGLKALTTNQLRDYLRDVSEKTVS